MSYSIFSVAKYILDKSGSMTAMKLQKLCYYAQSWSLVWDGTSLFDDEIQAWANGPVIPNLYDYHRGQYQVNAINGKSIEDLNDDAIETIDKVIEFYGKFNSQELSDLTHMESPWKDARTGLPDGVRSEQPILHSSMEEYYSGLNG